MDQSPNTPKPAEPIPLAVLDAIGASLLSAAMITKEGAVGGEGAPVALALLAVMKAAHVVGGDELVLVCLAIAEARLLTDLMPVDSRRTAKDALERKLELVLATITAERARRGGLVLPH